MNVEFSCSLSPMYIFDTNNNYKLFLKQKTVTFTAFNNIYTVWFCLKQHEYKLQIDMKTILSEAELITHVLWFLFLSSQYGGESQQLFGRRLKALSRGRIWDPVRC